MRTGSSWADALPDGLEWECELVGLGRAFGKSPGVCGPQLQSNRCGGGCSATVAGLAEADEDQTDAPIEPESTTPSTTRRNRAFATRSTYFTTRNFRCATPGPPMVRMGSSFTLA